MHGDVSKAVTESIRMGTSLWESESPSTASISNDIDCQRWDDASGLSTKAMLLDECVLANSCTGSDDVLFTCQVLCRVM